MAYYEETGCEVLSILGIDLVVNVSEYIWHLRQCKLVHCEIVEKRRVQVQFWHGDAKNLGKPLVACH